MGLKDYLRPELIVLTIAILLFFPLTTLGPIYCEEVAHVCPPDIYEVMAPAILLDIAIMLPMYVLSSVIDPYVYGLLYLIIEILWAYLLAIMLISLYKRIRKTFGRKAE
jgi:hypothetical protein